MEFIILGSGQGSRFSKLGLSVPKPFIDLHGKPFYRHVIDNYRLPLHSTTLVMREEHAEHAPSGINTVFTDVTRGPAETLLTALETGDFKPEAALAVLDCDCWLTTNLPGLIAYWESSHYTWSADALVFRVPHRTQYKHFTVPVPVRGDSASSRATVAPALDRFEAATDLINPGLYYFDTVSKARKMMRTYMESRPYPEPTLVRALEDPENRSRVSVLDLDAPFTCVGTPEEYEEQLCTR